ncbi:MAG: DUF2723 domain-containing protein, partial [Actinobacteria bacterium]|nr:DUF2723 domain-containing protein [Actinomycetota bacterium]
MLIMQKSAKKLLFFSTLAFSVPLALYILTLEPGLVGGDTSWYALQLPQMQVMVPTGYPAFSILGKIMSAIPAGDLAYRLNLFSAIFGALTILFLFLAINLLVKNEAISLAASLTFGFTMAFWTVANRLELDTLNSFFIALLLYSIFLYSEKRGRKHLYFCFASLGFSLTNHPIAFFIMPGFLLYVITVNLKIFKSLKAVLFSILYFLLPLSFYAWLPLRSIQGYGGVKTLRDFIMYVTGRNLSGEIHGGSFGDKTFADFLNSSKQFFAIIYENLGIILLIIAAAGLYALLKKNIRFAACSVLVILLNLVIVFLYLGWTPQNYVIDTLLIIALYIAAGLMFIFENIRKLTDKKISAG